MSLTWRPIAAAAATEVRAFRTRTAGVQVILVSVNRRTRLE